MLTLLVFLIIGLGSAELNFIAIGDWGRETTDFREVTVGMEKVAKDNNATFVALLGDNIYGGQVIKLKEMFETNYNSATLAKMPFYALAGNQDHRGNVSAQIAFTNTSKQWVFPVSLLLLQQSIPDSWHNWQNARNSNV